MDLDEAIELINLFLSLSAVLLTLYMCWKFADTPTGVTLVYFLTGMLFLSAIALFALLVDLNYLVLTEETFVVWWHGLFYASMLTFWFGSKNMIKLLESKQNAPMFMGISLISGVGILVFILTSFFIVKSLDPYLAQIFSGWLWVHFGMHHFIAVVLAGVAAFSIYKIRNIFTTLTNPFIIAFVLFSGIHLWELLLENWKIYPMEEEAIEFVEKFFWLFAYIALIFAFWNIVSVLSKKENQTTP